MNFAQLESKLNQLGLERLVSHLETIIRPCVRVRTVRVEQDEVPMGAARIGGFPDVPESFVWPTWRDVPLSFLAQLDFAELRELSACSGLPAAGRLLFFYDAEQSTWGFDPKDRGSWFILHDTSPIGSLVRRELPPDIPAHARYRPCRLEYFEALSLANSDSPQFEPLSLQEEELEPLGEFGDSLRTFPRDAYHQILGFPDSLQGDMQLECQLVANGLYCGDATGYEDPRRRVLAPGASSWRHLLQLASDDNPGTMWGDDGNLFFWLDADSLDESDFVHIWMILQCT